MNCVIRFFDDIFVISDAAKARQNQEVAERNARLKNLEIERYEELKKRDMLLTFQLVIENSQEKFVNRVNQLMERGYVCNGEMSVSSREVEVPDDFGGVIEFVVTTYTQKMIRK